MFLKKIKSSVCLSLIILTVFGGCGVSFADSSVNPYYIPKEGWFYESHQSQTYSKKETWSHIATNTLSVADSVTYTASRTMEATGTIGGETNFKVMQQKIGVSAEVSLGSSKTVSTAVTFGIPAKSKVRCSFGNLIVKGYGVEKYYVNGVIENSRNVNAEYSYSSYSDKTNA